MITFSAFNKASAVSSDVVLVISPSIFVCAWGVAAIPPKRTLVRDLFMATHMMYERMEPDTPIRAPTVVSRELSSINPSATSANPEYAFKTVMTTGISAPPIAAVVVYPLMKLRTAFPTKHAAPIRGAPGAYARKAPSVATFAPRSVLLMRWRPGSAKGLEDIFAASFKNATMLPVNVTPPMSTPR
jgi:hypothetical protein